MTDILLHSNPIKSRQIDIFINILKTYLKRLLHHKVIFVFNKQKWYILTPVIFPAQDVQKGRTTSKYLQ